MRRDYLIAIILFIAGLAAAISLMAAPEYLHLSPANVSITFWSGAILALILFIAAAITAFRAGKVDVNSVENMTLADIGFNTALAGGVAALAAAVFNARRTAVVACVIAWTGIGIDYWWGPPRGFLWSAPPNTLSSRWGLKGEPLAWAQPLLDNFAYLPLGKPTNITDISIVGANVSDKEIKLDDAYFLSGIDSTRIDAKISWAGNAYKVQEIKPVPAGAMLIASASFGRPGVGLSQEDFVRQWAIISFVIVQNGITQRTEFDKEKVKSMLPKPLEPFPHVSPIK